MNVIGLWLIANQIRSLGCYWLPSPGGGTCWYESAFASFQSLLLVTWGFIERGGGWGGGGRGGRWPGRGIGRWRGRRRCRKRVLHLLLQQLPLIRLIPVRHRQQTIIIVHGKILVISVRPASGKLKPLSLVVLAPPTPLSLSPCWPSRLVLVITITPNLSHNWINHYYLANLYLSLNRFNLFILELYILHTLLQMNKNKFSVNIFIINNYYQLLFYHD